MMYKSLGLQNARPNRSTPSTTGLVYKSGAFDGEKFPSAITYPYFQSNGTDNYLDTGIAPVESADFYIEVYAKFGTDAQIGCRTGFQNEAFYFGTNSDDDWALNYKTDTTFSTGVGDNNWHTFKVTGEGKLYVDGVLKIDSSAEIGNLTSQNIYLFAFNNGGSAVSKEVQIASAKIVNNGTTLQHLVFTTGSEVLAYDTVSETEMTIEGSNVNGANLNAIEGACATSNGTDNSIDTGIVAVDDADWYIETKIKILSLDTSKYSGVYDSSGSGKYFYFGIGAGAKWAFRYKESATTLGSHGPTINTWYTLKMTGDGKMYIDGVLEIDLSAASGALSANNLVLFSAAGTFINVDCAYLKIYNASGVLQQYLVMSMNNSNKVYDVVTGNPFTIEGTVSDATTWGNTQDVHFYNLANGFTKASSYDTFYPLKTDGTETFLYKNLFDKSDVTVDRFIDPSTGADGYTGGGDDVANYIAIEPNTAYVFSGYGDNNTYGATYDVAFSVVQTGLNFQFTSAANAVYVRYTIPHENVDIFQLELGASATYYEPYEGDAVKYSQTGDKILPFEGRYQFDNNASLISADNGHSLIYSIADTAMAKLGYAELFSKIAFNNLVVNGRFADGTYGWSMLNSSASITDNEVVISTTSGTRPSVNTSTMNLSAVDDEKWYCGVYAKSDVVTSTFDLFLYDGTNVTVFASSQTPSTSFALVSGISTIEVTDAYGLYFYIRATTGDLIIDRTEEFGLYNLTALVTAGILPSDFFTTYDDDTKLKTYCDSEEGKKAISGYNMFNGEGSSDEYKNKLLIYLTGQTGSALNKALKHTGQ